MMHYKECLSEEPKSKQELGLALLLHTSVRALSVQSVLRCGTKNAQSAAAAREHFEKRYPSSSPRQVAEGILRGMSVCTGCAAAPQWPVGLSPPAEGLSLAKLKMEGLRGGRGGGVSDRVRAMGIEDIADMDTDVLPVLRTSSVVFLRSRSARPARSARSACLLLLCLWRTNPVFRVLQETFVRFVRMAGLMAYELEEEWQLELPAFGAWSLVRTRELAAKKPRVSVCFVVSVVCALVPPRRLWRLKVASCAFYACYTYDSLHASGGGLAVLYVVQTAAWDWAPPHMSGTRTCQPRHRSTSSRTTKTQLSATAAGPPSAAAAWRAAAGPPAAGPPASLALWRAAAGPPPFSTVWRAAAGSPASPALWRAPRRIGRAAGASSEGAARPIHRCGREQEGAWAAAEPTRSYILRCGFQCVVCTEP